MTIHKQVVTHVALIPIGFENPAARYVITNFSNARIHYILDGNAQAGEPLRDCLLTYRETPLLHIDASLEAKQENLSSIRIDNPILGNARDGIVFSLVRVIALRNVSTHDLDHQLGPIRELLA